MRLAFVNNAHPDAPHVSGMRLSRFAVEMAARGHQVVLLTGANPAGHAREPDEAQLRKRLAAHDWARPMIVEVAPKPSRTLSAMRSGRLPGLLRRALTAWHFLAYGGAFTDWVRAGRPVADTLAREFKPDVVWATFGNTSNFTLAQRIAKRAGCPWIMDIKDNWLAFVPAGLRRIMARRFGNASGATFNAEHHRDVASEWLKPARSAVIYSGVAEPFYSARDVPRLANSVPANILLVGSTYSEQPLLTFLGALKDWTDRLSAAGKGRVGFRYAGTDQSKVEAAARSLGLSDISVIQGQLPIEELAKLARNARAACYLWASFGFHHKLLELLTVGTPVIAYPGEHAESRMLAAHSDTRFFICNGREALQDAFEQALSCVSGDAPRSLPPAWRWRDFAIALETFFMEVASRAERPCAE